MHNSTEVIRIATTLADRGLYSEHPAKRGETTLEKQTKPRDSASLKEINSNER
jgi:hypothetical protein